MTGSDLAVEVVSADRLIPLRRRVLRNDDPTAPADDARDASPEALHLGVFRGDRLVTCGSFYPAPPPVHPELASYQLRYLATDVDAQHHGGGRLLMRAAESKLASRGVEQLWANCRDTALVFYDKVGWLRIPGSEHLSPATQLPHTNMYRVIRRTDELSTRWATPDDAQALTALREEMYFAVSLREWDQAWLAAAARYFGEELSAGHLLARVAITAEGEVVGAAAAALRRAPPTPRIPNGRLAYVHTVSTRPAFRRRGVSRRLVEELLFGLRERGEERAELHATAEGEPLYRDLGFAEGQSPNLRLALQEDSPKQ